MRRLFVLVALLAPLFVSSHESSAAPATSLELLAGFGAKETCSCVFVVGQTDSYCTDFGMQPPYSLQLTIDHTAKTVTATVISTTRVARMGANGCTLDPLP